MEGENWLDGESDVLASDGSTEQLNVENIVFLNVDDGALAIAGDDGSSEHSSDAEAEGTPGNPTDDSSWCRRSVAFSDADFDDGNLILLDTPNFDWQIVEEEIDEGAGEVEPKMENDLWSERDTVSVKSNCSDAVMPYVGSDDGSADVPLTEIEPADTISYASVETPTQDETRLALLQAEYVRAAEAITLKMRDSDDTCLDNCFRACGMSILYPYRLLYGWRKKAPWACHVYEIQRWCRLFSAKAGIPAPPDVSSIKAALSFLRRTLDDYQPGELPLGLVTRIRRAFVDMDQERPARTKRIIGIRCSAMDKPIPRTNWKDVVDLKRLMLTAESYKFKGRYSSTDEAGDRLRQLKQVVTTFYARRYGLNESKMHAFVADTGSHFQKIHPARIGFIVLTALAERGQTALLPLPDYGQLSEWVEVFQYSNGITPQYYRLDPRHSWRLNMSELEEEITSDVGAFFLCNPAFMCGGINSERELECLLQLLAKKNVPLVVNEMLDYLVYEQNQPMHSPLELKPTVPTIVINSSNRWMTFGAEGLPMAWALVYDPKSQLPPRVFDALREIETIPDASQDGRSVLPKPSVLSAALYHNGWPGDIARYLSMNADVAVGILKRTPGLRVVEPKASYFVVCMIELREPHDAFKGQLRDDVDFAKALFKEESVKVFCGSIILGWPDCFAIDMYVRRNVLLVQCQRIDDFCRRHVDESLLSRPPWR